MLNYWGMVCFNKGGRWCALKGCVVGYNWGYGVLQLEHGGL